MLDEAAFVDDLASMRPPLNAGENPPVPAASRSSRTSFNEAPAERGGKRSGRLRRRRRPRRFNEAPAERGGKQGNGGEAHRRLLASMRPPLNAGENMSQQVAELAAAEIQ